MNNQKKHLFTSTIKVQSENVGTRIDQYLAKSIEELSRNRIQQWIKLGQILVNDSAIDSDYSVQDNDIITINAEVNHPSNEIKPMPMPLEIIFEDDDLLAINKPVGLVVHPGAGNEDNTLQNALLAYDSSLEQIPRAGIVHRLDKDTSGILIIAKTLIAHQHLILQMKNRHIQKKYLAVVQGVPIAGEQVNLPIGRHHKDRKKMQVRDDGKEAITQFTVKEKFNNYALLDVNIITGRTHQIRVHLAQLGFPLLGDKIYGGRLRLPKNADAKFIEVLAALRSQMLHAHQIIFSHPRLEEEIQLQADAPNEMVYLLRTLNEYDT